jgi:hypothetical protein
MKFGRVYQNYSTFKLLRLKSFFIICSFPVLIKNLGKIYSIMLKLLGSNITNNILKKTYGDIFVGGENTHELETSLIALKNEGLLTISDYAREFLTKEEEVHEIDNIIKAYKDSIDSAVKVNIENSIALKISSFGNFETMKKLNEIQEVLSILEDGIINKNSIEEIQNEFNRKKIKFEVCEEKFNIFKKGFTKVENFDFNVYEMIVNDFNIESLQILLGTELKDLIEYVKVLNRRFEIVFSHAKSKECSIMIDAEQSYLQSFIDFIAAYYFKTMNKERCIIMTTLQCYLKSEPTKLKKLFAFCKEKNLSLGLKLVRGAYMTEENKISLLKGTESPINSNIEQTHLNYDNSINFIFNNFSQNDKVIIS